jgi:hypothetical protein
MFPLYFLIVGCGVVLLWSVVSLMTESTIGVPMSPEDAGCEIAAPSPNHKTTWVTTS